MQLARRCSAFIARVEASICRLRVDRAVHARSGQIEVDGTLVREISGPPAEGCFADVALDAAEWWL